MPDVVPPEISASTKCILRKVQCMIPPMLDRFHKGQLGRIGVIGGSENYTGAPYFSAMASARLGCDMSHVFCTPGAGPVIKAYSPNLMVHPLMRESPASNCAAAGSASSQTNNQETDADHVSVSIIELLPRLHVLVIGPGLGRDPLMQATVARVIHAARDKGTPVVIDADGLQLVQHDPSLVKGYKGAVLTPNIVEFGRLWDALNLDIAESDSERCRTERLAKALGGATIILKGSKDYISNGKITLSNDLQGGKKRSGGQGDTLTGSTATFLGWRKAYLDGLWDTGENALGDEETIVLSAFGGSAITRECSRRAFKKKGRSLQAADLTNEVHGAFLNLFGEIDGDTENGTL